MKKWQKGLAVAGAAALAVGLSACGKSSKDAASKGDDSTPTLLMYRVGDKPTNSIFNFAPIFFSIILFALSINWS